MKRALSLVFAAAAAFAGPVHAFGGTGHEIVGDIAARHLSPAAKKEVERLFGQPADVALREASTWPDEIKELPGYGPLGSLHYVNFASGTCDYRPERDCAEGRCVIAGIEQYTDKLRNASSDAIRAEAVKWLVHLVGDVHMPLHASARSDRGGNEHQVQFEGAGTNLHRFWDSGLIESRKRDARAYARALHGERGRVETGGTATDWAIESCRMVEAIYPKRREIGRDYVDANLPIVEKRLRQGGLRLAAILNRTLDKPAVPVPYRPR